MRRVYREIAAICSCAIAFGVPLRSALAGTETESTASSIVYFDLSAVLDLDLADPAQRRRVWDETHLIASLQGLANREAPRLYVRYVREPDDFWWERMTEPGGWLHGRTVQRVASLDQLLQLFASCYRGAVVWDERVPATSNLASTIAGCDRLLCLRYDTDPNSLYQRLTQPRGPLEVKQRLLRDDGSPLFTGQGTIPANAAAVDRKCQVRRVPLAARTLPENGQGRRAPPGLLPRWPLVAQLHGSRCGTPYADQS